MGKLKWNVQILNKQRKVVISEWNRETYTDKEKIRKYRSDVRKLKNKWEKKLN